MVDIWHLPTFGCLREERRTSSRSVYLAAAGEWNGACSILTTTSLRLPSASMDFLKVKSSRKIPGRRKPLPGVALATAAEQLQTLVFDCPLAVHLLVDA
jgi:hypothetical protein